MDKQDVVNTYHGISFSFKKKGMLTNALMWMDLEDIMRREVSLGQKHKYRMMPLTGGTTTPRAVKFIETGNRMVGARGWGTWGGSCRFIGTELQLENFKKLWRWMAVTVAQQSECASMAVNSILNKAHLVFIFYHNKKLQKKFLSVDHHSNKQWTCKQGEIFLRGKLCVYMFIQIIVIRYPSSFVKCSNNKWNACNSHLFSAAITTCIYYVEVHGNKPSPGLEHWLGKKAC